MSPFNEQTAEGLLGDAAGLAAFKEVCVEADSVFFVCGETRVREGACGESGRT